MSLSHAELASSCFWYHLAGSPFRAELRAPVDYGTLHIMAAIDESLSLILNEFLVKESSADLYPILSN